MDESAEDSMECGDAIHYIQRHDLRSRLEDNFSAIVFHKLVSRGPHARCAGLPNQASAA